MTKLYFDKYQYKNSQGKKQGKCLAVLYTVKWVPWPPSNVPLAKSK